MKVSVRAPFCLRASDAGCPADDSGRATGAAAPGVVMAARPESLEPRPFRPKSNRAQNDRKGRGCHSGEIGRAHAELQSLMRISYAVFCLKKQSNKSSTVT